MDAIISEHLMRIQEIQDILVDILTTTKDHDQITHTLFVPIVHINEMKRDVRVDGDERDIASAFNTLEEVVGYLCNCTRRRHSSNSVEDYEGLDRHDIEELDRHDIAVSSGILSAISHVLRKRVV
jgi:hypothetical protein